MIDRFDVENLLLNYLLPPELVTSIADDVLVLYQPLLAELETARRAWRRLAGVVRGMMGDVCPLCGARVASFGDQHASGCPMEGRDG